MFTDLTPNVHFFVYFNMITWKYKTLHARESKQRYNVYMLHVHVECDILHDANYSSAHGAVNKIV